MKLNNGNAPTLLWVRRQLVLERAEDVDHLADHDEPDRGQALRPHPHQHDPEAEEQGGLKDRAGVRVQEAKARLPDV